MGVKFFRKLSLALLSCLSAATFMACGEEQVITLGTGNSGGLYYKFGNTFAEQIDQSSASFKLQVKTTAGTAANIRLLEQGFLDMAIVQSDMLKDAKLGTGIFINESKYVNESAIAGLYTETFQIIVNANSGINTVEDLLGKRVSVGEPESGVIRNAQIILEAYGLTFDKIDAQKLSFTQSAEALKEGAIDAFFCTAGIPTPAVADLAKEIDIKLLSIDNMTLERLLRLHDEYVASEVPANSYKGQTESAITFGMKAVLVANNKMDKEIVEQIATTLFAKQAIPISPSFATTAIPTEFHPGAASYYQKQGFKVNAKE